MSIRVHLGGRLCPPDMATVPVFDRGFLFGDSVYVAEGATSNVFAVVAGQLRTPALAVGILDGVTRGKVLELARANSIACHEVSFMSPDELRRADEAFLTSSVRNVLPVTLVDGLGLGDGKPGAVTRRLTVLHRQLVEAQT